MFFHFVKPGDSLYKLSKEYGLPVEKIVNDNSLLEPTKLVVNQCLLIDNDRDEDQDDIDQENQIIVNGYCYDGSNKNNVATYLKSLTYLSIFAYRVTEEGSLNSINDEPYIKLALDHNVKPIMVITNSKEKGGFSPNLASSILNDSNKISRLFNEIEQKLKNKKYYGLNIDFEYVSPQDKNEFIAFVNKTADYFHQRGYYISISLAPKYNDNQEGLLYEAHDYQALSSKVDNVILMTYEWGYTYGPAMAVAPYDKVKQVLEYAKTRIPKNKILMGLPNYGYDFLIPYKEGQKAKSITNPQAIPLAFNNQTDIKYNRQSRTPYFNYVKDSKQHEVHYDDPYSIENKLSLIDDLDIGGTSIWTVSNECNYIPLLIQDLYSVRKK